MEGKDILKGITLEELLKKAVEAKAEITVTMGPDNTEVRVEPWKPFEYKCPAALSQTTQPTAAPESLREILGEDLWGPVMQHTDGDGLRVKDLIRSLLGKFMTMNN